MDSKNIGKNIKVWRISKGLGQTDLAKLLGVTKSTVSSWESGRFTPSIEKINKLAEIFNIEPKLLLSEPPLIDKPEEPLPLGDALRLARKLSGIKQEEVAKKFNLAQSTVAAWERGKTVPSIKHLRELCLLYDVSACEMLGLVCFQKDARLFNLIKSYDKLNASGKARVVSYMEDMSSIYKG